MTQVAMIILIFTAFFGREQFSLQILALIYNSHAAYAIGMGGAEISRALIIFQVHSCSIHCPQSPCIVLLHSTHFYSSKHRLASVAVVVLLIELPWNHHKPRSPVYNRN